MTSLASKIAHHLYYTYTHESVSYDSAITKSSEITNDELSLLNVKANCCFYLVHLCAYFEIKESFYMSNFNLL